MADIFLQICRVRQRNNAIGPQIIHKIFVTKTTTTKTKHYLPKSVIISCSCLVCVSEIHSLSIMRCYTGVGRFLTTDIKDEDGVLKLDQKMPKFFTKT